MSYFRKDGSLDTTLVSFIYPKIKEINKLCERIVDIGGQFQLKKDGGVKFYLMETEKQCPGIRNFIFPENLLIFDKKPKILIEAVEHVDFVKNKKEFVRIFSNKNGDPFMSFYNPKTPKKEGGHAFFTFWEGYEFILYFEKGVKYIQIVKLDRLIKSSVDFQLEEVVVCEAPLNGELPFDFKRKFARAIINLKDKFECENCTHAHFAKNRPD